MDSKLIYYSSHGNQIPAIPPQSQKKKRAVPTAISGLLRNLCFFCIRDRFSAQFLMKQKTHSSRSHFRPSLHDVQYSALRRFQAISRATKKGYANAYPFNCEDYFFILACSAAMSAARSFTRFSRPSPRSKRTKRTTSHLPFSIFLTVMSGSLTNGCSTRQTSL